MFRAYPFSLLLLAVAALASAAPPAGWPEAIDADVNFGTTVNAGNYRLRFLWKDSNERYEGVLRGATYALWDFEGSGTLTDLANVELTIVGVTVSDNVLDLSHDIAGQEFTIGTTYVRLIDAIGYEHIAGEQAIFLAVQGILLGVGLGILSAPVIELNWVMRHLFQGISS